MAGRLAHDLPSTAAAVCTAGDKPLQAVLTWCCSAAAAALTPFSPRALSLRLRCLSLAVERAADKMRSTSSASSSCSQQQSSRNTVSSQLTDRQRSCHQLSSPPPPGIPPPCAQHTARVREPQAVPVSGIRWGSGVGMHCHTFGMLLRLLLLRRHCLNQQRPATASSKM